MIRPSKKDGWNKLRRRIVPVLLIAMCAAAAGCAQKPGQAPKPAMQNQMQSLQMDGMKPGVSEPSKPTSETDSKKSASDTAQGDRTGKSTADNVTQGDSAAPKHYPYVYPLTGEGSEKPVKERPVMIMVENQRDARPQSGLYGADVVYELLAEGGITRFAAVFQSHSPSIVGPVRSIRPYFVRIGQGMDALVAHAGGSAAGLAWVSELKSANFDEIYNAGAYFWRGKIRRPPHNLYTSVDKIRLAAKRRGTRKAWHNPGFVFASADEKIDGNPAASIDIHYLRDYHVTYHYDPSTGLYERFMNGEPHTDRERGVQLTARNIVVCRTELKVLDKHGHLQMNVEGPGKGYIFQKGKERAITWQRKGGIIRAYIGGKEVPLLPGQSWFQIIPVYSKVTFKG